ncbi:MAG: VWA domain-containing protein [Planctomycetes bacterium]|nr:VWA domain-containing protein [Planctomycetota bacterium]
MTTLVAILHPGDAAGWDDDPPAPIRSPGGVRTGIFGAEARGNRFVYVLDRSASMAEPDGRPLAVAKGELLRSIEDLGEVQQLSLVFYNDRVQLFSPPGTRGRLVFATDEHRRAAARFIGSVRAAGGTRHADALAAAFRLDPDVVFLLTDADAKDDLDAADVARLERIAGGARLLVVQFGDDEHRSPGLESLAERCGGSYRVMSLETAEALGTPP